MPQRKMIQLSTSSAFDASRTMATLKSGATQAGVDLFLAYGIELRSTLSRVEPAKAKRRKDLAFLSIAGFAGPHFSGFVGLGVAETLLRRSNDTQSSSYDWMAELANQFVGRIKNRLLKQGIVIHRTPPAVVQGYAPSLFYSMVDFKPVALTDDSDAVFIWMKLEPSLDGADLPTPPCGDVLGEGEMLLF
jgi:hypothetical protein